jgi:hypothetical protein
MLGRHIRLAGVRLIETTLSTKLAEVPLISTPTLALLKAKKTRELNTPTTASATVPKIVTAPSA